MTVTNDQIDLTDGSDPRTVVDLRKGGTITVPEAAPISAPVVDPISEPEAEPQPAPPSFAPPRGRHRAAQTHRKLGAWRLAAVVVVLAGLVAGTVVTALQWADHPRTSSADRQALEAGREAALLFTTYDYRHIDADQQRLADDATGTFKQQFTAALGALRAELVQAKGVQVPTVVDAALRERHGDTAVVLAAVNGAVTNTEATTPVVKRYRLVISLQKVDGRWLISDVTPAG